MNATKLVCPFIIACLLVSIPPAARAGSEEPSRRDHEFSSSGESISGAKSETTALLWSLLGTAVPVALAAPRAFGDSSGSGDGAGAAYLFLGALVIGPSLGHFYADRPGRAFGGIGLRTLALFGLAGAVAMSWDSESSGANGLAFASLALGAVSIIWDIAAAPASARKHNETSRSRQISLGITPPTRSQGAGLSVCVPF